MKNKLQWLDNYVKNVMYNLYKLKISIKKSLFNKFEI